MRTVAVLCCLTLSACAGGLNRPSAYRLSPEQAVMNAAASPGGTSGIFEFAVRAAGRDRGNIYLNSERDYRDPRNLSVVISPSVAAQLTGRFGAAPDAFLVGKVIAVRGTARKTKILFLANGRPTTKYYYQTHLRLGHANDLTVSGERPRA